MTSRALQPGPGAPSSSTFQELTASTHSVPCAPARRDLGTVVSADLTWAGPGLHAGRQAPRPLEAASGLDPRRGPGEWMMYRRRSYTRLSFLGGWEEKMEMKV